MTLPTLDFEKKLWTSGVKHVVGIDEVGRGALAGPVVAGAVVFNSSHHQIPGVRDSKTLTVAQKTFLAEQIYKKALFVAIGEASAKEIDQLGIVPATALAMQRALQKISQIDHLLIDGKPFANRTLLNEHKKTFIVKGDSLSYSIAAASIVAKVYRDRYMKAISTTYPEYGFESHVGYGTAKHRKKLRTCGLCLIHRSSFCRSFLSASPPTL